MPNLCGFITDLFHPCFTSPWKTIQAFAMESLSAKLCRRCSGFEYKLGAAARKQDPSEDLYVRVNLARNIWALQTSAKRGCVLCRLIYQATLYQHPGILQRDWESETSISLDTINHPDHPSDKGDDERPEVGSIIEGGSLVHSILRARSGTKRSRFRASLDVKDYWNPLQSDWETRGYGPITTLSLTHGRRPGKNDDYYSVQGVEAIAKLGRMWLSECRTLHKQCNDASQEGHPDHGTSHIIPTRLVDVGLDGDDMFPRLTITNGSGLYSGKLGIRYLWVDALCILQSRGSDDTQHELDWQLEAARFGQYYENSILTIAATGAQSASERLFLHRAGQVGGFEPYTVQWTDGSDVPKEVTVYPKVPCWGDEIMDSPLAPLASRGWAAQERLMSRRILHFAANCVCWECYELQATEGDPSGCVLGVYPLRGNLPGKGLEKSARCLTTIPPELIPRMWYDYIETYSGKKFPHVSDRLPALSARANRVQSLIPHQFLEGMWAENNVTGLAWRSWAWDWADGPKGAAAPSWSWASARGSVQFTVTPKTGFDTTQSLEQDDNSKLVDTKFDTYHTLVFPPKCHGATFR
ncbi:hypothetical protein QBC37DRAFT_449765 [Rhypophila decipiens]|uniref:Heterokaryon incompatibility domain-containing protein n=1 Tax=Rhypophila decipiens TaxID=261697 RepID=A0AAN6XZT3_9PEZI|nr:hypothetical protein QBC37DRAFT_449765 [Rhypophila decipiens]